MTDRVKWSLLGALLVVWIAVIALRAMTASEPPRAPLKFVSGQALPRDTVRSAGAGEIPASLMPIRASTGPLSFKDPKNIFAPLDLRTDEEKAAAERTRLLAARKKAEPMVAKAVPSAEPLGPPPPTPEELAAREEQRRLELAAQEAQRQAELARQQAELARQQKEQAIQQARAAMGKYRFLGYLTRNGAPQAFLGKGKEIYIVKTGETIEGKIQVKSIEAELVKLLEQTTSTEASLTLVKEGS